MAQQNSATRSVRVLMVDDDPMDLVFMRNLIGQVPGIRFSWAAVGTLDAGLSRLSSGGYDLLLLDLNLPDAKGLDGLDAVRELVPTLPIVVVSGSTDPHLERDALSCGADAYLRKIGITVEEFAAAVQHALGERAPT